MKKISYYDLQNTPVKELQKQYKLSSQQLEHSVRHHIDGASAEKRTEFYKQVYDKKKD